jgi:hypothetical protein
MGHVACIDDFRDAQKPRRKIDSKESAGRSKRRWKDDIKLCLKEKGTCDVGRVHLDQDANQWLILVNSVNGPSGFHEMLKIFF